MCRPTRSRSSKNKNKTKQKMNRYLIELKHFESLHQTILDSDLESRSRTQAWGKQDRVQ